MSSNRLALQQNADSVIIPVRVVPRSSQNRIAGVADGELRLRITAAPVEGAANNAIVVLLSKTLGIPKSQIVIISGETSPRKRVRVSGVSVECVLSALLPGE